MVKPQFELGQGRVGKGGVVRSLDERREAVGSVVAAASKSGLGLVGVAQAGVPGPKGNQEVFVQLRAGVPPRDAGRDDRRGRHVSGRVEPIRTVALFTMRSRRRDDRRVASAAAAASCEVLVSSDEDVNVGGIAVEGI